jgi:hypothetical protein
MRKQGSLHWLIAGFLLLTPIASRAAPDPINQWEGTGSLGGYALSAAFGNGTFFVTAGGLFPFPPSGQLLTSTNGLNWQVNPLAGYARGVAIAEGTLIVVGAKTNNTALVMASSDGTNWADLPGPTNIVLSGICYGSGKYVAWGGALTSSSGGPIVNLVSSNAIDWLIYTNYNPNNQPYFSSMTYGDGTFAGIAYISGEGGYTFGLFTSTNGFTWTRRAGVEGGPGGYSAGIAFGNHTFVGPNVISTNGIDFYPLSIPTLPTTTITFGNGTFLAAGWESTYATSTNGFNWNAYSGPPWGWDDFQSANIAAFGNSRFIVSDNTFGGGYLFRSGDVSIPALSGRRAPPGFAFSVRGEVNRPYHIQISDDLQNWSELMTVTNPLPITDYSDPTAIDSTNRFYRALLQR